jgi:predicted dehydrogenase
MTRYGILGFGHHAIKRMMKAFNEAHESKLVGLWRRDAEKAKANAQQYSIPQVFESPEALCASPEVDAVFIASPDSFHLAHVLLAAENRKPVLCEKPLGMNAAQVEEMLAATREAGVAFGVAQNMRYYRSLQLIREWIAAGRIGNPVLAHSQFAYPAEKSPRVWIYDPSLALGGPIGDVAVHCLDALRFVMGTDVRAVTTLARRDELSGEVESHAIVGLDFTSSAMGSVTVTTRAEYRTVIEITGETGVILCENGLTVDYPVDVVLRRGGETLATERVSNEDAYSLMLDSFSAWATGKGTYLATGEDGLHNQRVLDAAYQSWRTGARQSVESSSD